jgi:hypothetical protein
VSRVRTLLVIVVSALGGIVILAAVGAALLRRPQYEVSDVDIASAVTGRWDWSTRLDPCRDSAHTIAVSGDRKIMTITLEYLPTSDSDRVTTYDIQRLSRSSLRGAIRGETRRTDAGVPVVWDLVLFGPTEYRWHRTDWNAWGYTESVIRCTTDS